MTIGNGAVIDGNTASGDSADDGGGGIFNNGGALVISDLTTVIRNNLADGLSGSGGGIFSADGGSVSITDATVLRNTATIDGGGLFALGDSASVDLTGVVFSENTSGDSGAGAFVDGPTTTISGSRFTNNQALGTGGLDGDGGGLFLRGRTGSGSFNISGSGFSGNTALGGGGGALFVDADGSISDGGFFLNQVSGDGITFASGSGGLAIIGQSRIPSVSISGVSVNRNTAPAAAGIGIIDSLVTIDNADITDNAALESLSGGGGLGVTTNTVLAGNALTLNASLIAGNSTTGEGGGLGVINGNILITDSTIRDNQATGGRGGGIGLLGNGVAGTAILRRTTIHGNTASVDGGGIAVLNMGLELLNVTISSNDAAAAGGGIAYDNSVDTVARSISFSAITSNTSAAGGSNVTARGSSIDVTASIFNDGVIAAAPGTLNSLGYNLDSGNSSGFSQPTDIVNTPPLLGFLLDNGGPVFTHALLQGSPAIDAGPLSGPLTDARSVTRPLDGDGDGTPVFDIGAFEGETVLEVFVDDVQVDESSGAATVTVQLLGSAGGPFSVDYATVEGTATQPSDYAAAMGTLSFAGTPGETQSFTVSIVDDAVVENPETLSISLSNPSNTMVDATDTATLAIIDNDVLIPTDIDLGTSITDAPDPVLAGQIVEYKVTVTNFGSNTAGSVVSSATIPTELTVSSAGSDLGSVDIDTTTGVVTTTIATIAPGTTVTITINAVAGTIPGTVTVDTSAMSLTDNDTDPSNDMASEDTTIAPTTGLQGHVFCDVNDNGQADVGEQGMGTLVFLDANDSGRLDSGERSTTTDAAGYYRFDNINETTVNVSVSVPASCNAIPDEPRVRRSTIQVGDLVRSIDSVDVDGDGDRDLVAVAEFSESLTVIENETGEFISGTDIAVGDRPRSVDTFETGFSASHTVTIAVAGVGTSENGGAVYTTDGQSAATRHPSSSGPIDVLVDDFNADGLHDVLSASFRQPLLELRMGGSSDVLTTETLSAQVLSIDSGNLDTDGLSREVVVSGYGFRPFGQTEVQPTRLEVFRTSGPGGVSKFASIVVPAEVVEVEVADVIGNDPSDGIDDFVDEIVVLLHTGKLLVYPMSGGAIGQPIETAVRGGATAFDLSDRVDSSGRLVDFNGDGKIDVAVANMGARPFSQNEPKLPGFIELYTGTGDGRFARATEIRNVSSPADLVVDDFSGDGFAEIAVANFYGTVNVDVGPPEFSLPSAITILQLGLTSREVTVTAGEVITQDFPFPSADPHIIAAIDLLVTHGLV